MADAANTPTKRSRKAYPPIRSGDLFGRLTVVEAGPDYIHPTIGKPINRWWLRCDCGKVVLRHQCQLHRGQSRDCGCGRRFQTIPIGTTFGKLTVIAEAFRDGRAWRVPCLCDCGNGSSPHSFSLTSGKSTSCGKCKRPPCAPKTKRAVAAANTKHGWSGSSEYAAWIAMKKRCHDPRNKAFRNYGGRGINVCTEWRGSFEAFIAHIGPKPSPELSIDRIDNERGYEPGNVRWADAKTQNRNRRPFMIVPGSRDLG